MNYSKNSQQFYNDENNEIFIKITENEDSELSETIENSTENEN